MREMAPATRMTTTKRSTPLRTSKDSCRRSYARITATTQNTSAAVKRKNFDAKLRKRGGVDTIFKYLRFRALQGSLAILCRNLFAKP